MDALFKIKKLNRELDLNNMIPINLLKDIKDWEIRRLQKNNHIKISKSGRYIKILFPEKVEIINCPNWFNYNLTRY